MEKSLEIEPVAISEILDLASWNRPRSDEELRNFINSRHSHMFNDDEIE